jgi:hypothetical protein
VGFPDSCSTAALNGARKRREEKIQIQIFQSPTLSHHAHFSPPPPTPSRPTFPPSTSPQWLHRAHLNRTRILPRPPHLHHNNNQSPQTPTKSHGMAIKCIFSFPLSLSLPHPSTPQVQHLHLGLLQKARLSQDRKRARRRGRHLSRL